MAESMRDLEAIWGWVMRRESPEKPRTVLIGGWAVYAHNPWYGSIDIDIATTRDTKTRLMHKLTHEMDYEYRRTTTGKHVFRRLPGGHEIVIDFMSRKSDWKFEGLSDHFDYDDIAGRLELVRFQGGFPVRVPTRALLAIMKLKACWDRAWRLENRTSADEIYDRAKLVKDRADVIALLDQGRGSSRLDWNDFGMLSAKYPFLKRTLSDIPGRNEAVLRYARLNRDEVADAVSRLIALTSP